MTELSTPDPSSKPVTPWWVWPTTALWLIAVGAGSLKLVAYANQGTVPTTLIAGNRLETTDQVRLEMFIHPHCPCSAASLRELQKVLAYAYDTECTIYFYRPVDQADSWVMGSHWRTAMSIPNVKAVVDPGGKISAQRKAQNSGEVQVFDPQGVCRFQGGLTPSRGHEGDNIGQAAILAMLRNETPAFDSAPVFGCSLRSPGITQ